MWVMLGVLCDPALPGQVCGQEEDHPPAYQAGKASGGCADEICTRTLLPPPFPPLFSLLCITIGFLEPPPPLLSIIFIAPSLAVFPVSLVAPMPSLSVSILRRDAQINSGLEEDATDLKELEAGIAAAKEDLLYITWFPRSQAYMSLFPPEPRTEARLAK